MRTKLNVEISAGELLDKITILDIKKERINDQEKLSNINAEFDHLMEVRNELLLDDQALHLISELKKINEELWTVEDQLREFEMLKTFNDKFIFLARSVYLKNDQRSRLKKELNLHLGSHFVEEKSYNDYQLSQ